MHLYIIYYLLKFASYRSSPLTRRIKNKTIKHNDYIKYMHYMIKIN